MSTFLDLMALSADGVVAIDAAQSIVFWNRASEDLTGIPACKALGRRCHDVLKGQDAMGRPLCKRHCPLSSLAHGGLPPAQLSMRITHTAGQTLQFCVGTMLIPSSESAQWNVVHVMRRGRKSQMEGLFDQTAGQAVHEAWGDEQAVPGRSAPSASLLTGREQEILGLLAHGRSVDAMSTQLHISATTVRNHLQRMMNKLDVHNRVEAVAFAHRHQLV